ncbi:MAG: hypothetical protein ACRDSH_07410 [Pseudonocardiaceae bacterium]
MTGPTVTGASLSPSQFVVAANDGEIDLERAFEVLQGRLAVHIVHNYIDATDCARIAGNFWLSTGRRPRYGDGADGVEGYLLGASHIEKSVTRYLDEVQECQLAVNLLYSGVMDPLQRLRSLVATHPMVRCARPARHEGRNAADSKAVCWNGSGSYLLEPHDDVSQLSDPLQADFEIHGRERVTAVNLYPAIARGSGPIKLWNVMPDRLSVARLGLQYSGFPYPPESLEGYPSLVLDLRRGDLCLLNGNLVHAVMRGEAGTPPSSRLLITCFMSFSDQGELLWWT